MSINLKLLIQFHEILYVNLYFIWNRINILLLIGHFYFFLFCFIYICNIKNWIWQKKFNQQKLMMTPKAIKIQVISSILAATQIHTHKLSWCINSQILITGMFCLKLLLLFHFQRGSRQIIFVNIFDFSFQLVNLYTSIFFLSYQENEDIPILVLFLYSYFSHCFYKEKN